MDVLIMPRVLLIAGSGRNSGKTTLACEIISKFSASKSIVAIKISPHLHKIKPTGEIILDTDKLLITSETDISVQKDSARMLAAGARKSFFIMTERETAGQAFSEVLPFIGDHDFIVCESGGLRNFVKPGLFLLMQNLKHLELKPEFEKMKSLADQLITFDGVSTDFNINTILISENQWKIKNFKHDNF
jgi:molybdopterin-guanine dinucleotide biosynthesis protein